MENIVEKSQDDQDFLYSYGSVRTRPSSPQYRENYDRIFNKSSTDRETSVDVISDELKK